MQTESTLIEDAAQRGILSECLHSRPVTELAKSGKTHMSDLVMRGWKAVFLIAACLCFVQSVQAQSTCPCSPGSSCTVDSGLVTAYCGTSYSTTSQPTSCPPGAFYGYASAPVSALKGQPYPCMNFYLNTADGAANHNPTIIVMYAGGDASVSSSGNSWCLGVDGANGSENPVMWGWITGTAFAGTPMEGVHWNVACIQFSLFAAARLTSHVHAGVASVQVNGIAGGSHFWPQDGNYTLCIDSRNQECIAVSSQTGSFASQPYKVTLSRALAHNHSSGVYVWAVDANGRGGPAYPNYFLDSMCDLGNALGYLAASSYPHATAPTLPGNGHFVLLGLSGTGNVLSNFMMYGRSIQGLAAPQGCGWPSPNLSWTADGYAFISPGEDEGVETVYRLMNGKQASPCRHEDYRGNGGTDGSYIMGAYSGTVNSGKGKVASLQSSIYTPLGLGWKEPNALTQMGRNVSGQGCVIGIANSCYYPQTDDTYLAQSFSEIGPADTSIPCPVQYAFAKTVPGASYRFNTIPGQMGHGAGLSRSASGGACTSNGLVLCANSQAAEDIRKWMSTLNVFGNATNAGAVSGGTH